MLSEVLAVSTKWAACVIFAMRKEFLNSIGYESQPAEERVRKCKINRHNKMLGLDGAENRRAIFKMAKLIYPINVSLDGYMEDERGNIE